MIKQLKEVQDNIEKYKIVEEVTLVGVSKTRSVEEIHRLVDLGVTNLGENRPQELRDKYSEIDNVTWHMIGRLQSNKIKYVINTASLIHSVDSEKLMEEINEAALKSDKVMEILLQVNTSNEESKQGVDLEGLHRLYDYSKTLSNIKVVGLMTMAPLVEDEAIISDCFKKAKEWYDLFDGFKYLSMGMSHDYVLALQNGSNMLRIGSLLFEED